MPENIIKRYNLILVSLLILMSIIIIIYSPHNIYPNLMADEHYWHDNTWDFLTHNDNKPLPFLLLWKAIGNINFTRIFTYYIIIANTLMIWRLTKNKLAFAYPLIPMFLNSMWLTTEILVTFCLLLSFQSEKYKGWFAGLAVWFNPLAVLYGILIKNKIKSFAVMCFALFVMFISQGLVFWYARRLIEYGSLTGAEGQDWLALTLLPFFMFAGLRNKMYFQYGLISLAALLVRQWGHYFVVPYSLFFLAGLNNYEKRD